MDRSSSFRTLRFRRYPWWVLPGLLTVFFSVGALFISSPFPVGARFIGPSSLKDSIKSCVHEPKLTTKCSIADHHTHTRKQVITSSPSRVHGIAHFAPKSMNPALTHKTHGKNATSTSKGKTVAKRLLQKHALLRVLTPPPVYQGGEAVSYSLVVSNDSTAGPVLAGDTITISDSIPAGLTNLTTSANSDWTVSLAATTSPTTLTATYVGTYPIAAGATLSTITLNGTLTSASVPTLANTATVVTPNDSNAANNSGTSSITVQPQPDLAITETVPASTTFQVGHTADFTLSVSNVSATGSVLAGSPITVTSAIPAGLTGLTATTNSDWTVVFNSTTSPTTMTATYVGTLPVTPGTTLSSIVLHGTLTTAAMPTLTNPATVSTPYDSNLANNSTSTTITVVPQPDMAITETVPAAATFQVGHTATFTITASDVSGAGPVQAGDPIIITSAIPTGLTGLTTSANSDWTIVLNSTTSPTTMTATYAGTYPVAAGTSLSPITLTGTLTTAARPTLTNPVAVSTPDDSNAANNTASVTITVVPQPDMTVTETVPAGATFQVGHSATFTITASDLSSAGPVLAGDPIIITSAIPTGLTGLTTSANSDWTIVLNATTSPTSMTATYIGTYPVASGTTLSPIMLTGTLTTNAMPTLTNPVTVSTPNDSNAANDTASVTITVLPQPDMTITETVPVGDTFQVGHTATFTITASDLSSAGPVLAGDPIIITSDIPNGLTGLIVGANSNDWLISLNSTDSPTTLTATYIGIYPVAPGTTLSPITLTGTLTAAAMPTLTNPVTVSTPNDSNAANNTASVTITVLKQPDMTVTETVPAAATFQVGHTATFTITGSDVSGAGPVQAGDPITITSAIPAGLTGLTTSANSDWTIVLNATTSPTTMTATYNGTYPVNPGTSLSPITLTGTLTSAARPTLTNPVTVSTPDDSNAANNTASVTITVLKQPDLSMSKTVQPA